MKCFQGDAARKRASRIQWRTGIARADLSQKARDGRVPDDLSGCHRVPTDVRDDASRDDDDARLARPADRRRGVEFEPPARRARLRRDPRPSRAAIVQPPRSRPPSASRRARTAARAGAEIVRAEPSCDDDDDECFFELGPDGRLAEPLEAAIPGDYYSLLQLDFDADPSEVKRQYRQLQKWCHPDIAGEAGTEVCIILNEAYDTLMDEKEREVYDRDLRELQKLANLAAADGSDFKPYTGQPLSKFVGSDPRGEQRAVFVNESACIGCRQCNHSAPNTFFMEEDWGRARAFQQWADTEEDIDIAIESCPVDCIYWVKQRNLPILEYAMQRCERATVGVMNGSNVRVGDPFDVANSMIRKGEEARARMGMDPSGAMEGAAATGKIGTRIREAFLKLGENVRGRWSAYDEARESLSATYESMDEGDVEEGGFDSQKSFFDFD